MYFQCFLFFLTGQYTEVSYAINSVYELKSLKHTPKFQLT